MALRLSSENAFGASEGFFHRWRHRRAKWGMKIVSRKAEDFGTGTETDSMEDLIKQVENFWVTWVSHRVLYDLTDWDFVVANDEFNAPMELHSGRVYELAGVRHPWILSNGFRSVRYTVFLFFTLANRKLSPVFIFSGVRGKRLDKQSKQWIDQLRERIGLQEGQNAYFFLIKRPG